MKRKTNKMVVSLLMMCSILGTTITHNEMVRADNADISLMYEIARTVNSELTISGTTATCTSRISGSTSMKKVVFSQMLQKKNTSGNWSNVASWSGTKSGTTAILVNSKSSLAKGTYRVKTIFTVYSGNGSETITKYSGEKKY